MSVCVKCKPGVHLLSFEFNDCLLIDKVLYLSLQKTFTQNNRKKNLINKISLMSCTTSLPPREAVGLPSDRQTQIIWHHHF